MLYAIAALLVLIADQALKYYVTLNIPLGDGVITLIPGFMSLVNYHNTGAAFSMLSGGGARWAFVVLAVSFTAAVIYLIANRKLPSKALCWTLTMVAAGAMGNAIDRAFYGYVVDMFRTDFMDFAIFNIADIFITLGGFALCAAIVMMPSEKNQDELIYDANGENPVEPEKSPGVKLFSEKPQLPEDVQERRRTGKLYGERKPLDAKDPFAEFENMPKTFEKPKKTTDPRQETSPSAEDQAIDQLTKQLQDELSLESILDEFSDGNI